MKTRSTCRLCNSTDLKLVFPMPSCPPVDNFHFAADRDVCLDSFPMDLYMCSKCGHAQLIDIVPPEILFGSYIYTSSSSPDLSLHFDRYVDTLTNYKKVNHNSLVIDIGSNDGLFLSKFLNLGVKVLGIEPAEFPASMAKKIDIPTEISFLNSEIVERVLEKYGSADIVTANNVFSHNDDLRGFALNARSLLNSEGLFVFEVSYLLSMINNKVADYIYHEHLAHHSVLPLKKFFDSIGMTLVRVDEVSTKGGSIRGYAALKSSSWIIDDSVEEMIAKEKDLGIYEIETYTRLQSFYSELKNSIHDVLLPIFNANKLIASYGASATATVFNKMMDIDRYLSFTVDDNKLRQGRLTPSSKIPVVGNDILLTHMPEIVIISSWRFADLIIENNSEYLSAGGKFLVPQPLMNVVTN
ncbi:methyltransferase domain-containing protein [Synechococcus sp. HIMB2401]|uniref:methyltransferase domain-containing protein n=1 Tax=Synechococcus sp. HIMB2401 TaxID=3144208 RepID=UPI0036F3533B